MLVSIFFTITFLFSYTSSEAIYTNVGPASNPAPVSNASIAILDALAAEMVSRWEVLDAECSPNAVFALLYIYMTRAGGDYVKASYFEDGDAMTHLIYVFAQRYLGAADAYYGGSLPSAPWQQAYNFSASNTSVALQDMLMGVNAHINYDLGIATFTSGYGINDSRKRDYDRVNDLMNNVTDPSLCDLGTRYDSSLLPGPSSSVSDTATIQLLVNWRDNAWTFAEQLYNGTITYQEMSDYAVLVAQGFKNPALLPTNDNRVAYCQANHNTNPMCSTGIFR